MKANKKNCIICGQKFPCPPSREIVTCSIECRKKYSSLNHKGMKHSVETKQKMSESRKTNVRCREMQALATEAAKLSPKSGRFKENIHAIDWHLISPSGKHYKFHSLRLWLRENSKELFGVEPESKQYENIISGLSRTKRSMLGTLPQNQRPNYTYKGWRVIPTSNDTTKRKK